MVPLYIREIVYHNLFPITIEQKTTMGSPNVCPVTTLHTRLQQDTLKTITLQQDALQEGTLQDIVIIYVPPFLSSIQHTTPNQRANHFGCDVLLFVVHVMSDG